MSENNANNNWSNWNNPQSAKANADYAKANEWQWPPVQSNPTPSNEWDKLSRDELIILWDQRKKVLTQAKEQEMELRKYIVSRAFPEADEGTNTLELGNGYQLKAVVKYSYKLRDNNIVETTLNKISKIGNQGSFIADRLVSWTPNFLVTEYNNLKEAAASSSEAQEILAAIGEMLIVEDAAPTLNIKEPKIK